VLAYMSFPPQSARTPQRRDQAAHRSRWHLRSPAQGMLRDPKGTLAMGPRLRTYELGRVLGQGGFSITTARSQAIGRATSSGAAGRSRLSYR
jgi:hypothetical protein